MTSRDGRKSWGGELPVETVQELRKEAREKGIPQWKLVHQSLQMSLGLEEGSTESAIERQIEEAREENEELEEERQKIKERQEELEERIETLTDQLEEIREKKQSYKECLDEILDKLVSNPNKTVMAYMSDIRDAATDEYGRDTKENLSRVISDLRTKRDERGLAIEDHRFSRTGASVKSDAIAAADGGQSTPDLRIMSESADNSGGDSE